LQEELPVHHLTVPLYRHAVFQGLPLDGDRAKEIFQHFSFLLLCFVLVNELSVDDERLANNGFLCVYGNAVA